MPESVTVNEEIVPDRPETLMVEGYGADTPGMPPGVVVENVMVEEFAKRVPCASRANSDAIITTIALKQFFIIAMVVCSDRTDADNFSFGMGKCPANRCKN